ncbi:MAG: hypothetical protein ABI348_07525 [Nitrososphaera sp.]
MQGPAAATYHVTMDDEKLGVKPEILFRIYGQIEAQAKDSAPVQIRNELRISQDARIKTRFYIAVSDRMAQHLIAAVQKQASGDATGLRSYFYKLQEQLMAQMFAGAKDTINISLR